MVTLTPLLVLAACSVCEPPVGYDGPLPSVEARRRLAEVRGREVPAGVAGVEEAGWVVAGFVVGGRPYIALRKGDEWRHLLAEDDEDVDAFLGAMGVVTPR